MSKDLPLIKGGFRREGAVGSEKQGKRRFTAIFFFLRQIKPILRTIIFNYLLIFYQRLFQRCVSFGLRNNVKLL